MYANVHENKILLLKCRDSFVKKFKTFKTFKKY